MGRWSYVEMRPSRPKVTCIILYEPRIGVSIIFYMGQEDVMNGVNTSDVLSRSDDTPPVVVGGLIMTNSTTTTNKFVSHFVKQSCKGT